MQTRCGLCHSQVCKDTTHLKRDGSMTDKDQHCDDCWQVMIGGKVRTMRTQAADVGGTGVSA